MNFDFYSFMLGMLTAAALLTITVAIKDTSAESACAYANKVETCYKQWIPKE